MSVRVFNYIILATITITLVAQVLGRLPQRHYKVEPKVHKTTTEFPDVIVKPMYAVRIDNNQKLFRIVLV
jgi:hypothetical protein